MKINICFLPDFDSKGQFNLAQKKLAPIQYLYGALIQLKKMNRNYSIREAPFVKKRKNKEAEYVIRENNRMKLWINSFNQVICAIKAPNDTKYIIWGLRLGIIFSVFTIFMRKRRKNAFLILFRFLPFDVIGSSFPLRIRFWILRKIVSLNQNIIVVASKQVKEYANSFRINKERIKFLEIGIDTEFFSNRTNTINLIDDISKRRIKILFHGDADRDYKTAHSILKEVLENVEIIKTGLDPKDLRYFESIFKTSTSYLNSSYTRLREIISQSDIVIIPTSRKDYYTAGLTSLLEALAMKKPVILTDDFYLEDYTKNNTNIHKITQKLTDQHLLSIIDINEPDIMYFRSKYSLSAVSERFVELLEINQY